MGQVLLRCASFNVLAEAYQRYSDLRHAEPGLLEQGVRLPYLVELIGSLDTDVIGLQEVELPLVRTLEADRRWKTYWTPKTGNRPDGCLLLVRQEVNVRDFRKIAYSDGTGHVAQWVLIGEVAFINTHLKWAEWDDPNHAGVLQVRELLDELGLVEPAVIMADCNDHPGGPVRELLEQAGFMFCCEEPTALVDGQEVSIDIIAYRGVRAKHVDTDLSPLGIPTVRCPSDHMPLVAEIEIDY